MTFPFHLALLGAAAVFAVYLLLREPPTRQKLTYGPSNSGSSSAHTPLEDGYDTSPLRRCGSDSNSDCDKCSICLEDLYDSKVQYLKCTHGFHANCIRTWLRGSRNCPLCNRRVK